MIRLVENPEDIPYKLLEKSWCGRRILSYLKAYGAEYEFCRFYNSGNSIILIINSTMLICGEDFDDGEINSFVNIYKPFRIEGSQQTIDVISNKDYHRLHRTTFQLVSPVQILIDESEINFNPSLDDVYSILTEGFPNLTDYPLWLADTSHRIRHGVSCVMTYKSCTTASISYDINNCVLVGQVATRIASRGSGYARRFLTWLAGYLEEQGKTAVLYALDMRKSFYREIGFKAVEEEFILEKSENGSDNILKGKLQYND